MASRDLPLSRHGQTDKCKISIMIAGTVGEVKADVGNVVGDKNADVEIAFLRFLGHSIKQDICR